MKLVKNLEETQIKLSEEEQSNEELLKQNY